MRVRKLRVELNCRAPETAAEFAELAERWRGPRKVTHLWIHSERKAVPRKSTAVRWRLPHAVEMAIERAGFDDTASARGAWQELGRVVTEQDVRVWLARWGTSVSAQVVELSPGEYEFAGRWSSLSFAPGERRVDSSKIFAVVLADATAVLCDGFLRDEIGLVGGGQTTAGELMRVLVSRSPTSESIALSVLKATNETSGGG